MRRLRALAPTVVALATLGCSDDTGGAARSTTGAPAGCRAGEWARDDGTCVPAGLPPDMPCPPGEWLRETDSTCIPAGVPPDACGQGFVHDGDRGCEPILPVDPCPAGLMAVPGETECHEIAPCGSGTWGDIPVEADTEHVDQSYAGVDSDGSAQKPWKTIGDAVASSVEGGMVAIAAGTYVETITITGNPLRLWGRCPAMVEIVGTGATLATVYIQKYASGAEVHGLAIRGDAIGLVLSGSEDVLVERVWIHDNDDRGIDVEDSFGATSITVRSSLIENNRDAGVLLAGSAALLESTVVRGTMPGPRSSGRGVSAQVGARGGASAATLRGMVVEHNREFGVHVAGSEATIEAVVVRDTSLDDQGHKGRGVNVVADPTSGAGSTVSLRASLLEKNHEVGAFVGASEALIETTVVRQTRHDAAGHYGVGVAVRSAAGTNAAPAITLRASLVEDNHVAGVFVDASEALIEATVVRDTIPVAGYFGEGVYVRSDETTGAPSTLMLRASLVERNTDAGVVVRSSSTTVEASLIRATAAGEMGFLGDGVVAVSIEGPASITITATRIEQSARAAVATFGATAAIGQSELVCQTFDLFGVEQPPFAFSLEDLGGNLCGCPDAAGACAAKGEGLAPPPPAGGLE